MTAQPLIIRNFLDSNPSGQWLWIEVESGDDITGGAVTSSIMTEWHTSCTNKRQR